MDEKALIRADTLELLLTNQIAIRAMLEELLLWVSNRSSVNYPPLYQFFSMHL